MATVGLVLLAVCVGVHAFPEEPLPYRNTIFNDEKLEGQIFENVDLFNKIQPLNRQNNAYRLPTSTKPTHYTIEWQINIAYPTLDFSGIVEIDLHATQPNVNEIVIHTHELNINSLELTLDTTRINQTYWIDQEYDFLRVNLVTGSLTYDANEPVVYKLSITFNAPLRTDMYGIYSSWYNSNNQRHWMASTQFQGTSARSAFPCYDEPSFKATFDITIRRPEAFKSWSCTRQMETGINVNNGYASDVYHTTPIMSTYLLALIVAEYETVSKIEVIDNVQQITYEVIGREEAIDAGQGQYAFNVGQELLEEMSSHTDMDFYSVHPKIKMTQAAIPDFSAGAMENWGLLTYREAYLLYDENHTNSYYKQLIAYILSHEIAHMWFGNLVTCDWWDVLWLNEGFARYYQYFLTDWVENYMGLGSRFINEQVHSALLGDSAFAHPLSHSGIGSKPSVSSMFSTISYNKGAAIIRMTEHLMGFNNHRQGLRKYLRTRAHQTAIPNDLFEDLQETALETGATTEYGADFSIIDYYKSWTQQGGHPVLNVDVNRQTGIVTIYQRRFNINTGYSTASANWIVPVSFATESSPDFANTKPTHIISEAITALSLPLANPQEWIIFNKQQTGFYRVNYDDYSWNLIIRALRSSQREVIHEYNRAQIVDDVFQFARSGLMSYNRAFNILSFLRNENAYTPWVAAISGFQWIRNRLTGTSLLQPVNELFLSWAAHVMSELTYVKTDPDEPFMRSYLRYQLAPVMCFLGDEECITSARQQFDALFISNTEVPVDSRGWVYCNALRQGDLEHFQFLWDRFTNHPVYTEKILILSVLGCTTHAESLNKFLDEIVEENFSIRKQDYTTAFSSAVSANEANTQIVFTYIQNNLDKVEAAFGSLTTPLSYISARLRTRDQVTQFQDWALQNQIQLGQQFETVYNAAENSIASIEWAESTAADINSYVTSDEVPITTSTAAPATTTAPETFTAPAIQEPATPDLPDSANTSFLSVLAISLAVIVNFVIRPF